MNCYLESVSQAEPWMAKTAAFHGRISAGIGCKLKMATHVFTELGSVGFQGEAGGRLPLGVVATATPIRELSPKPKQLN